MKNLEIERKFTVNNLSFKDSATKYVNIKQGYIAFSNTHEVKVSIRDSSAYICVKSKNSSLERFEWFKQINVEEAETLLKQACVSNLIYKTRYYIPYDDKLNWEVDVFHGENEGLIIAEIEVPSISFQLNFPDWIDREVTGDWRYYNHSLSLVSASKQMHYDEDANYCPNYVIGSYNTHPTLK